MQAVRSDESSNDFSVISDAGHNFLEPSLVSFFFLFGELIILYRNLVTGLFLIKIII